MVLDCYNFIQILNRRQFITFIFYAAVLYSLGGLSEIFKEIYNSENINFANRLDYETSGLVIGCKTLKFLRYISEKIRNNEVHKKYIAVVHGIIKKKKFTIENYLYSDRKSVV